jgi:hypothetical protein
MTFTATHWPPFGAGAVLIAPGADLPPEWRLEYAPAVNGWSRLANTFDLRRFEREQVAGGWTFFFMAGAITATAFGWNRPRMFDIALARLLSAMKLQECNCLELNDVGMRSFLGIPYLRISAHPRHIQKGAVFSGR